MRSTWLFPFVPGVFVGLALYFARARDSARRKRAAARANPSLTELFDQRRDAAAARQARIDRIRELNAEFRRELEILTEVHAADLAELGIAYTFGSDEIVFYAKSNPRLRYRFEVRPSVSEGMFHRDGYRTSDGYLTLAALERGSLDALADWHLRRIVYDLTD